MTNQNETPRRPLVVIGRGFFVPLADQFPESNAEPALAVYDDDDPVRVHFRPYMAAYPGNRVALHQALDRWLDEQEQS